jgi:hypothetical protein
MLRWEGSFLLLGAWRPSGFRGWAELEWGCIWQHCSVEFVHLLFLEAFLGRIIERCWAAGSERVFRKFVFGAAKLNTCMSV